MLSKCSERTALWVKFFCTLLLFVTSSLALALALWKCVLKHALALCSCSAPHHWLFYSEDFYVFKSVHKLFENVIQLLVRLRIAILSMNFNNKNTSKIFSCVVLIFFSSGAVFTFSRYIFYKREKSKDSIFLSIPCWRATPNDVSNASAFMVSIPSTQVCK